MIKISVTDVDLVIIILFNTAVLKFKHFALKKMDKKSHFCV